VQLSQDAVRELSEALARGLPGAAYWTGWIERGVRCAVILTGAWVTTRLTRRLFRGLRHYAVASMNKHGGGSDTELEKRAATLSAVIGKVAVSLIWLIACVMALHELAFNVQPLIAGLGVAGLALGLGAQSLIKDWLGGVFMLIEDQVRIGDSVSINGVAGGVEEINLRTTVLRSENGAVHTIPNGSINQLSNFTREYSYYVFETTLAHGAPANRALDILKQVGDELGQDPKFAPVLMAPLEVMGVDRLGERGAVIRARLKTLPSKQTFVGRELNRRVKQQFDKEHIPFPGAAL